MRHVETVLVLLAAAGAAIVVGLVVGPIVGGVALAATALWLHRLMSVRAPMSRAERLRRARMDAFRRR